MRVLGLIPARGGSKGVPRKNLRELGGKPLLAWTAEAALAARRLSRVVLTTDDDEIAAVGRELGIDAPFLRPAELAGDRSPTLPAVQHAVRWLEEHGERFDAICLLQPTSPFRSAATIDSCIERFAQSGADALVTTLRVPAEYNPHWVYFERADGVLSLATGDVAPIPRRQDLPAAFHREGSIYLTRRDVVMEQGSLYGARLIGFELDPASLVNIDSLEDWARAEALLAARG